MVLAIATALVKTLASYLFSAYLKAHYGSTEIDGAPSWYGQEPKEAVCVSVYKDGGIEQLNATKNLSKEEVYKKIKHILEVVIYKNFKHLTPDEEAFLNSVKNDPKLKLFIDSNIKFQNILEDEDEKKVFIRTCLDKEGLINYEKNRVKDLVKQLSFYKSDKGFADLENKKRVESGRIDKEFRELEESIKGMEK